MMSLRASLGAHMPSRQVLSTATSAAGRWHLCGTRSSQLARGRRQWRVRASAAPSPAAGEADEATQRRLRESARVTERVQCIYNSEDWHREVAKAGTGLVVLEVESPEICQTGFDEAEAQWREDKEAALAPCQEIKHVFARTARDCPEVTFLALEAESEEAQELCDELGIRVLPTVQFWKEGSMLWEHRGIVALQQDLGEGVLYYADTAANGVKASTFVEELRTRADYERFISSQPDNILTVVQVSLQSASPCVHIFPATMALAKNFAGYAAFARLIGDTSDETRELLEELNIVEVPTFVFFRGGKAVGRHVGSSRGDLIGQILQQQNALGIAPPPMQRPAKSVRQAAPVKQPSPASLWR